jgi:hypothetical protein
MKKVILCVPTYTRPYDQCMESIKASVPLLDEAGWEHGLVHEIGCPYISGARATMLRKALDAKADAVVFIDHDLSWRPEDLVSLISKEGVVAGLYRFKEKEVKYMGVLDDDVETHLPKVRKDGCIKATRVPAGFLKVTKEAVNKFMAHYPELCYGEQYHLSIDLFNHGAHNGQWWGEDYAFSRNWLDMGEDLWIDPDLSLTHHSAEEDYPGNFHEFLIEEGQK